MQSWQEYTKEYYSDYSHSRCDNSFISLQLLFCISRVPSIVLTGFYC